MRLTLPHQWMHLEHDEDDSLLPTLLSGMVITALTIAMVYAYSASL